MKRRTAECFSSETFHLSRFTSHESLVGRRGALSYEFERAGSRTILTRSSCTSPWHHFPPSYLDDSGCAYTWLVNPSGGLVGGDHVSVEAQLHARTHVLMTSPSANRIYRSLSEPVCKKFVFRLVLKLGWNGCPRSRSLLQGLAFANRSMWILHLTRQWYCGTP